MRNIVCSFFVFFATQAHVFSVEELVSIDSIEVNSIDTLLKVDDSPIYLVEDPAQINSKTGKSDTLTAQERDALIQSVKQQHQNATYDKTDSSLMYQKKQKSPKLAGLLSTMLPGAGQVYNRGWRSWWKVGIIYGGAYLLYRNMSVYSKGQEFYHGALLIHDQDTTTTVILTDLENYADDFENIDDYVDLTGAQFSLLTEADIKTRFEDYRSSLQNMYLFSVVLYGFNILDAVVDAHLKSFDISDDISMRIKPSILNTSGKYGGLGPGISIKLSLK